MVIKLTHRQQEFLNQFLDMYREQHQELHYSAVARRIGVGNVSAYEMLRLLEQRGLVEATYALPAEPRGPGRAAVLFRPTSLATQLYARLAGDAIGSEEWEAAKQRILRQMEAGKLGSYESLVDALLARAPEQRSALIYAAEVIATLILALESLGERLGAGKVVRQVEALLGLGDSALNTLVGLSLGLSAVESVNRRAADFTQALAERLQSVITELSEEGRHQLAEFAQEAVRVASGT